MDDPAVTGLQLRMPLQNALATPNSGTGLAFDFDDPDNPFAVWLSDNADGSNA